MQKREKSGGGGGELIGPWQPTKSRLPVSRVWSLTTRPGPASYTLKGSMGKQPDSTKPKFPMSVFGSEAKSNVSSFMYKDLDRYNFFFNRVLTIPFLTFYR